MPEGLVVGQPGSVNSIPQPPPPPPPPRSQQPPPPQYSQLPPPPQYSQLPPPPQSQPSQQQPSQQQPSQQQRPPKQPFALRAGEAMQQGFQVAQQGVQQTKQFVQQNLPQRYSQPPQYQQQYAQQAPPQQGMSGVRKGAIGFSLLSGLFPLPFNPLFLPIQMTIFIIMIIVLLFKGYSFWTAALLSWLIPGLIAAVIHYMFLSGVLSIMGYGEAIAEV